MAWHTRRKQVANFEVKKTAKYVHEIIIESMRSDEITCAS